MKSGSLNFLEPSGLVQSCNGTAFTGLNTMIGLLKVLKYHVKGKEVIILYNETLMIFK
jgi:hypothetical protein